MALGTVKWFSGAKGFGFIAPADGGADLFFHHTQIEGTHVLPDDQPVEYELGEGRKGTQAVGIRAR